MAKEEARSQEEKLLIQARTRSNLDKIAKAQEAAPEEPKEKPLEKPVDLKKKKEVSAAIKKLVKEIESGS